MLPCCYLLLLHKPFPAPLDTASIFHAVKNNISTPHKTGSKHSLYYIIIQAHLREVDGKWGGEVKLMSNTQNRSLSLYFACFVDKTSFHLTRMFHFLSSKLLQRQCSTLKDIFLHSLARSLVVVVIITLNANRLLCYVSLTLSLTHLLTRTQTYIIMA